MLAGLMLIAEFVLVFASLAVLAAAVLEAIRN